MGDAEDVGRTVELKCGNCFFFVSPDGKAGQCRASCPVPILVGMRPHRLKDEMEPMVAGYFAPTQAHLWCGQFQPKPDKSDGKSN